jgi:hypothetical protein
MYEIGRKDENPEKKRSEHPIGGFSREAVVSPVAFTRVSGDPNCRTNDYENGNKPHLPLFGKTRSSIKVVSELARDEGIRP